jgi:FkbM family methyltransferase
MPADIIPTVPTISDAARHATDESALARICAGFSIAELANELRNGTDPLGTAFTRVRTAAVRRKTGATYTPSSVVDAMVTRLRKRYPEAARIVDCGAGSGRFTLALARAYPRAHVIAVEADPLAALILRSNVMASGCGERISVIEGDFRTAELPATAGQTLFVGNPPYVRHHDIDADGKAWLDAAMSTTGIEVSRLSGLHVHFFLRVAQLAACGDAGLFITSAEWLESSSGKGLRQLVAERLGGAEVFVVDPAISLFEDAQVTSAITEFRIGDDAPMIKLTPISSVEDIAAEKVWSATVPRYKATEIRWSVGGCDELPEGMCRLEDMFSVHRGQVTGGNAVWIASKETPPLPERFLMPCVTKATDLINAGNGIMDGAGLRRVIRLPADPSTLDAEERNLVEAFKSWAQARGAKDTFTAKARRCWWALSFKDAAPILCTYMGRRPPVFVRNFAGVGHLNISHGLFPKRRMTERELDRVAAWLAANPVMHGGKTYGGGLRKFEPRDIERIAVPLSLFEKAQ